MASKYLGRAEDVWDDSLDRVRSLEDKQAIHPRKPDEGGLYRAWSRSPARFHIPSLGRRCAGTGWRM